MDKVVEVISTVLDVSVNVNSDMTNTKEWDSFAHVLIMMELQSEFGLNIKQEDFHELTSVKKIIEKLVEKGD
jgi:acyl carrier protein